MFNFIKKNILWIAFPILIAEIVSGAMNGLDRTVALPCCIVFAASVLFVVLECKILNKNKANRVSSLNSYGGLGICIVSLIISFVHHDGGFTTLSIIAGLSFVTEFVLIKIFDIQQS